MCLHSSGGLIVAPLRGARLEEKFLGCMHVNLFLEMVWAKPASTGGFRRMQMLTSPQRVDFGSGLIDVIFLIPFSLLFTWVTTEEMPFPFHPAHSPQQEGKGKDRFRLDCPRNLP